MKKNSKACILIVDDKPANLLALEGLLADSDRILLYAATGAEALKITLNKTVDLVILDVHMPGMDGYEVAQIMKSNKRTRDIPIIFATAENKEHKNIMKGYEEGAVDYLFKPLDPQIVKAKVDVLLKLQLQKKELVANNSSLQQSALLINNSADIIGILDTSSFKWDQVNKAFSAILGYTQEEINETPLTLFLCEEERILLKKLNDKKQEQLSFETRVYCKDRSIKWLQWKVVSLSGKWFINARDVTVLKESERIRSYLGTVVQRSMEAIFILDEDDKIISWNQGAERIYGYQEEEALKMKVWNLIPQHVRLEFEQMLQEIKEGNAIRDKEVKRVTKQGSLKDALFSAFLISDERSNKISIAITERDITIQKKAEAKLRENEQFLKSILDTIKEGVVVADLNGQSLLLNPAAEDILGANPPYVKIDSWPEKYGLFHSDKITPFIPEELPLNKAIKGLPSAETEMFILNGKNPKGIFVTTSSNSLLDPQAGLVGVVSVIHNIDERKKTEEALKDSEQRFRHLFEFAPYPMWVYDIDTLNFLEVNQPAINHYGYSREEFLQKTIKDIRSFVDHQKLIADIKNRSNKVQSSSEWRHQLRNGNLIDVEITSHLLHFRGRKACLVIAKDITEQKKAQAKIQELNGDLQNNINQLKISNQELESFSYSVSHDLRAPLRGLNGYSTMLEEDYGKILDEEGRRLLGKIQQNAHKMGILIDDLLAFSRLGRKEIQRQTINSQELLNQVLMELNNSDTHRFELNVQRLHDAAADLSLLRQVWYNLISNAIKYSSKTLHPRIEVGSTLSEKEVMFYIKDNGTGFNMKYADKLFGVFQRLHSRTDFEGTGIGLAIVHRIITKHGGRVWAEAVENEGATFYFTLPLIIQNENERAS
ncbi:MAG: PAS domain S-box protein [Flavisolibacter sp.]